MVFLTFLFRKDKFPFGMKRIRIYHRSNLDLVIIPPGGFYTDARRMPNVLEIEKEFSYGYSLTYGIFKKFNKNNVTCKENLNFSEDNCKLNQVNYTVRKKDSPIVGKQRKILPLCLRSLYKWMEDLFY